MHQHATNLPRITGALSKYTNLLEEPPNHASGRSRGGLTTKIHQLCDGKMRPLVVLLRTGQGFANAHGDYGFAQRRPDRPGTGPHSTRPGAGRQGLLGQSAPGHAAKTQYPGRHFGTLRPDS
ncbi:hypothetical protein E3O28_05850 [Cryobacterium sp. TMT2-14]|nr:hypothetical protein E3O28_05850 [Cryobacterium sp. TMT2-14]